jgi:glyoxylase-like metal-dependent hydrolase (beta-lactamase superfamily II)
MGAAYRKGLHEVADGVWAYLQPDGGWGWSNAGLVTDGPASLLVDTLFDLALTAEMLAAMRRATPAAERIGSLVNTHANGDHCYGNALVAGSEIVASRAAAAEMAELPPSRLAELMAAAPGLGELGAFVQRIFGPFRFDGIELTLPTRTFEGELGLRVGDREVRLLEVGPAHTAGDVVVHLPAEGVLFTGDILFHGGHPIVWAGPVANWVAACERLEALGAATVVPGHGALATTAAIADLRHYFEYLTGEARARFDAGMGPIDAAHDIDPGPYAGWGEGERLVVNVCALYRDFGADVAFGDGGPLGAMAAFAAARGPAAS